MDCEQQVRKRPCLREGATAREKSPEDDLILAQDMEGRRHRSIVRVMLALSTA